MCKISAFSSAKTYQKVECLHIWKIQVYIYIYRVLLIIICANPGANHCGDFSAVLREC